MPVAGVMVQTRPGQGNEVSKQLKILPGISVHGVVEDHKIVTVIEADSLSSVDSITNKTIMGITDVLGVYPVYINFEDEYI